MNYPDFTTKEIESEIWMPCTVHPRYVISNLGRVKNTKTERILKPRISNHGYVRVSWTDIETGKMRDYSVHRLVLFAFGILPLPDQTDANHLDHNRTNNRLSNLEWTTRQGNLTWAIIHNRMKNKGETSTNAILTESDARIIHQLGRDGESSAREVAAAFNTAESTIYDIWNGRGWKHLGLGAIKIRKRDSRGRMVACTVCGKETYRPPHQIATSKFCSRQCHHQSLKGKPFNGAKTIQDRRNTIAQVPAHIT